VGHKMTITLYTTSYFFEYISFINLDGWYSPLSYNHVHVHANKRKHAQKPGLVPPCMDATFPSPPERLSATSSHFGDVAILLSSTRP